MRRFGRQSIVTKYLCTQQRFLHAATCCAACNSTRKGICTNKRPGQPNFEKCSYQKKKKVQRSMIAIQNSRNVKKLKKTVVKIRSKNKDLHCRLSTSLSVRSHFCSSLKLYYRFLEYALTNITIALHRTTDLMILSFFFHLTDY